MNACVSELCLFDVDKGLISRQRIYRGTCQGRFVAWFSARAKFCAAS